MRKHASRETPLVGITPDFARSGPGPSGNPAEPLVFVLERSTRAIIEAGGVPLVLPPVSSPKAVQQLLDVLGGILVTGGNFDIHPRYYGEDPIAPLGEVKEERTRFELKLISMALERDLPILGVCGGQQAINIALGGSLYQDIGTQIPRATDHQRGTLKTTGGHPIKIHDGTKLREILGQAELEVNTTHHQAVKKLGQGLIVNATAEDGVIEGIESKDHAFVVGVQWHPEFLMERHTCQRKIFSSLISACKGLKPRQDLPDNS